MTAERRGALAPWRAAGRRTQAATPERAVHDIGWVFNNELGQSLAEFVRSGDVEVQTYGTEFGLLDRGGTLIELGSGVGRMTAGFTRAFDRVVACDVDPSFLARCRETVAAHGRLERLATAEVVDGRRLAVAGGVGDVVFSYLTLQHCRAGDAKALVQEAARVAKPGGRIALNLRSWSLADALVVPIGTIVRAAWRIAPGAGWTRSRLLTRLGWQANRLGPRPVLDQLVGHGLSDVRLYAHPDRPAWWARLPSWRIGRLPVVELGWINRSHWWLVADVGRRPDSP